MVVLQGMLSVKDPYSYTYIFSNDHCMLLFPDISTTEKMQHTQLSVTDWASHSQAFEGQAPCTCAIIGCTDKVHPKGPIPSEFAVQKIRHKIGVYATSILETQTCMCTYIYVTQQ